MEKKLTYIYENIEGLKLFHNQTIPEHNMRNLLRRAFVLTDDFLKIAPRYKNVLRTNAILSKNEIKIIEDLLSKLRTDYDNSYDTIRDYLSAHFKKYDYLGRIDWWNEIDNGTITIFCDEIIEITNLLMSKSGANHRLVEFENMDTKGIFNDENVFSMSTDSLSLTKKNTVGIIYCHETQEKAGRILTLIDLIDNNLKLTYIFQDYKTVYQKVIFDSAWLLIINDVVSLISNLFDDIDGDKSLLTLWKESDFKGTTILQQSLNLRNLIIEKDFKDLRNMLASHIDINTDMQDLETKFENLDLMVLYNYYNKLRTDFFTGCSLDIRTKMFLVYNQELKGVIGMSPNLSQDYKRY